MTQTSLIKKKKLKKKTSKSRTSKERNGLKTSNIGTNIGIRELSSRIKLSLTLKSKLLSDIMWLTFIYRKGFYS
jgi:hypothetical protein